MAVLLKHCDLGYVVLSLVEHSQMEITGKQNMPKSLSELCRVVCQTKRSLIKVTDAKKKKGHVLILLVFIHFLWS